jgi:hypothetical protein
MRLVNSDSIDRPNLQDRPAPRTIPGRAERNILGDLIFFRRVAACGFENGFQFIKHSSVSLVAATLLQKCANDNADRLQANEARTQQTQATKVLAIP